MLVTTEAIVLSLQPYSDKAHILHAYTRANGRVNYMVYGIGRKNPRGLYTPFSLIQITADHSSLQGNAGGKLPSLKEATTLHPAPYSLHQQTMALFICEVLSITLRHPMQDEPLFDFLKTSVMALEAEEELPNFHLSFLIGLAAKLGFAIDNDEHPELFATPSTRAERQERLHQLCAYYAEHIDTWQHPKSLDVLIEVFD